MYSQLGKVIQDLGMLPVNTKFPSYFNCIKTWPFFGHELNCKVGRRKRYHGHCAAEMEPEYSAREGWPGEPPTAPYGFGAVVSIGEDEPKLVEYLEGFEVLQAVSGFDHNVVLLDEGLEQNFFYEFVTVSFGSRE
ncbi:hypothetical protein HYC85_014694 [Camellia sinensis]|uniref:Uncharacterized protein n=1 Tax=Camellia sinensis TaxID=4442 RepID=A0A7J7H840_CAMSI|nr:hypothetical protein HYC85_014694 [Camellia sinensis]